jgi:predicted CxxxxCH...CXXCH cytochrome family protein
MRNISTLSAAFTLSVLLSACADGNHVEGLAATGATCTRCHGGLDNDTGAPPYDTHGQTSSAAVGAHATHLTAGVRCGDCHPVPADAAPSGLHQNGHVDVIPVAYGRLATDGSPPTITLSSWSPATQTCSNYCHTGPGAGLPTPTWNGTLGAQKCAACHAGNGTYGATDLTTGLHDVHRCASCHGETNASVGCQACHAGYQRQLGGTAPVVNAATHVDFNLNVGGTSVPLLGGVTVDVGFDRTTLGCTTNCHGIHGVSPTQYWQ